MGKIIRRTVTVTMTETWTIVWTDDVQADDAPQCQAPTLVQNQVKTQEEPNAVLPTTKPSASSQRKRTRGRRAAG
jgi:hypothetical protein